MERIIPIFFSLAITSVCLFGSAGRVAWPNAWVLLGVNFLASLAATLLMWRDPELAAERRKVKAGKSWDKALIAVQVLLGPVATWITAGLDARFGWSEGMPAAAFAAGVAVAVMAAALIAWAMRANRFFSSVVRIQRDRGHVVVTAGPYGLVRHPGYLGIAAFALATPLILGSKWAFVPAAVTAGATVLRTALEDRTLRNELEGYANYGGAVKYRLVPFLW